MIEIADVVMMSDTEVRQALRGRRLRYAILSPFGTWLGKGRLRVLRVKPTGEEVLDLTLGYESYERI